MKKILFAILVLVILIGGYMRAQTNDYVAQVADASASGWVEDDEDAVWTFVSANAGGNTFVVYRSGDVTETIFVRMRVRAKQGAGFQYFIVHAVGAYDSGNDRTPLTLFGGSDYDLSAADITNAAYSLYPFPLGFPVSEDKWAVEVVDTSQRTQSTPTADTWYNIGTTNSQISLPVGLWKVSYHLQGSVQIGSATQLDLHVTLSDANNTESNTHMTSLFENTSDSALINSVTFSAGDLLSVASDTTYYLNAKTSVSADQISYGGSLPTIIRAVSAYL